MNAKDLQVGEAYFIVSYEDPGHRFPLIMTYEYLGDNIHGEVEERTERTYSFKYIPSFMPEAEIEGYTFSTQARFGNIAHEFVEEHLSVLCDIDGLIGELTEFQRKRREVAGERT